MILEQQLNFKRLHVGNLKSHEGNILNETFSTSRSTEKIKNSSFVNMENYNYHNVLSAALILTMQRFQVKLHINQCSVLNLSALT